MMASCVLCVRTALVLVVLAAAMPMPVSARSIRPTRPHLKSNLHSAGVTEHFGSIPIEFSSATDSSLETFSNTEMVEGDIIAPPSFLSLINKAVVGDDGSGDDVPAEHSGPKEEPSAEELLFGNDVANGGAVELSHRPGRERRGLTNLASRLWPRGGIVPYVFETNWGEASDRDRIQSTHWDKSKRAITWAIRQIHEKSCVKFMPLSEYAKMVGDHPDAGNFIKFMPTNSRNPLCRTLVGRQYGIIPVYIGANCYDSFGSVLHELLHVVGFHHEQSRPDRDQYVDILTENIVDYEKNNISFRKYSHGQVDSLNVPYDYGSIMHYSGNQFSRASNLKTIVAKRDPSIVLGQRDRMSENDVKQLNLLYRCPAPAANPCESADTPVQYYQTLSFRYRSRKWLVCDRSSCRRKSCMNLSDSLCESEPAGCRHGKFHMLPVKNSGTGDAVRDGDRVSIVNARDLFADHALHCPSGPADTSNCRFAPCVAGVNCSTPGNTFVVRKRHALDADYPHPSNVYQNSTISLCMESSGDGASSEYERCLSCFRYGHDPTAPCRMQECRKGTPDCVGIYFNIRQWPSR